jgi:hypothetical protein
MEQLHDETWSVEFYQSIDDNIHVAARIGGLTPPKTSTTYAYYSFLALNTVVFPAFLLFINFVLLGGLVFILNLIFLAFIVPRVNTDAVREYYRRMHPERENRMAVVELNSTGIRYSADGVWSFWPWTKITGIEETSDSIFFYFEGNGFGVRTSGFAYAEQRIAFLESAQRLRAAAKELPE